MKCYLVDDDVDILELVKRLLTKSGHQVWTSNTSEDVLPDIIAKSPDCILIDLMMPGLDGLSLCQQLRADERLDERTKIVILSAKAYDQDRRRALKLGANAFIPKPLVADEFAARLERIVKERIRIGFWGVRGTLPVPGAGSLRYGGNTSCMTITLEDDQLLIFDAGTGIKHLSDHLMQGKRRRIQARIFISHPHWDHINALPFFVPLYLSGNRFEILGPAHGDMSMEELISAQMDGVYFPITMGEFGAQLNFTDLREGNSDFDGTEVRSMLLSHPGNCLGYRINRHGRSICYITDNELFPEDSEFYSAHYEQRLIEFVRDCDLLITDTTYTDQEYESKIGWGHSRVSSVVDLAIKASVQTLCLFHHDPDQSDDAIDAKLGLARERLAAADSDIHCLAPAEGDTLEL